MLEPVPDWLELSPEPELPLEPPEELSDPETVLLLLPALLPLLLSLSLSLPESTSL